MFERTRNIKRDLKEGKSATMLQNKVVGLLFEKPSTRTRTSFEVATLRLGGQAVYLPSSELQLSRGEPIKDTARILGSYLDAIVARVYAHDTVVKLSSYSGIPVINGLSDLGHPTQIVCDLFTVLEAKGSLEGLKLAFIGDGNNVCNSLLLGAAITGMDMTAACPAGYHPEGSVLEKARKIAQKTKSSLEIVKKPADAAQDADILYTDVWVSMGEDKEKERRIKDFKGYQINADLLEVAAHDAVVMHCLPAHRGLEITDDVIEGKQSIVWVQGENKLYGAAGILDFLL
ncbi:MAG: ornithine carbamoyltransferase, partial [Theionarchaea archaeon]|nr:ornithine carbamoyltransferase [Theionarchaea archaeon]